MITVERISFADIRDQPDLLAEYVEECRHPLFGEPKPDWPMYEALEALGKFQVMGVFVDGELAGFSGIIVSVNPHYSRLIAATESLFVSKCHDGEFAAARLIDAVEEHARSVGCEEIVYSAPAGGRLEKVLAKRYQRTNSVFCKSLRTVSGDASKDSGSGRLHADTSAG